MLSCFTQNVHGGNWEIKKATEESAAFFIVFAFLQCTRNP